MEQACKSLLSNMTVTLSQKVTLLRQLKQRQQTIRALLQHPHHLQQLKVHQLEEEIFNPLHHPIQAVVQTTRHLTRLIQTQDLAQV